MYRVGVLVSGRFRALYEANRRRRDVNKLNIFICCYSYFSFFLLTVRGISRRARIWDRRSSCHHGCHSWVVFIILFYSCLYFVHLPIRPFFPFLYSSRLLCSILYAFKKQPSAVAASLLLLTLFPSLSLYYCTFRSLSFISNSSLWRYSSDNFNENFAICCIVYFPLFYIFSFDSFPLSIYLSENFSIFLCSRSCAIFLPLSNWLRSAFKVCIGIYYIAIALSLVLVAQLH